MRNLIYSIRNMLSQYEVIENASTRILVICNDSILKGSIASQIIVVKDEVRLINEGDVKAVIYAKGGAVVNRGRIEGLAFIEAGRYEIKKNSSTVGTIYCAELIVQPGGILDGELVLEPDKNKLLEIAERELDASKFRQLMDAIKEI